MSTSESQTPATIKDSIGKLNNWINDYNAPINVGDVMLAVGYISTLERRLIALETLCAKQREALVNINHKFRETIKGEFKRTLTT